jgi:hypothetical protein
VVERRRPVVEKGSSLCTRGLTWPSSIEIGIFVAFMWLVTVFAMLLFFFPCFLFLRCNCIQTSLTEQEIQSFILVWWRCLCERSVLLRLRIDTTTKVRMRRSWDSLDVESQRYSNTFHRRDLNIVVISEASGF